MTRTSSNGGETLEYLEFYADLSRSGTLYSVLGLTPDSSRDEIRRAYLIAQEAYVHAVLHDDHHAHDDHHGSKHHGGGHPQHSPPHDVPFSSCRKICEG